MERPNPEETRPVRIYITPITGGVKADINGDLIYRKTEGQIWDFIAAQYDDRPSMVTRRPPLLAECMPPVANGEDRYDTIPSSLAAKINPHMKELTASNEVPMPPPSKQAPAAQEQPQPAGKTEVKFNSGVGGCSLTFATPLEQIAFLDTEVPTIITVFINHLASRLEASKAVPEPEVMKDKVKQYLDTYPDERDSLVDFINDWDEKRPNEETSNAA